MTFFSKYKLKFLALFFSCMTLFSTQYLFASDITAGDTELEKNKRILSLLNQGISHAEIARNKDVVLILGNTGSGKSTIINYLLGCAMRYSKGRMFTQDQEIAKIGHSIRSETLFPTLHSSETFRTFMQNEYVFGDENDYAICDCPGFYDNRSEEERICASILTEMVVRKAENLRVAVVVDYHSLTVARGYDLDKLSDTLNKLLPRRSFPPFLLFNKVPLDVTDSDIKEEIQSAVHSHQITLQTAIANSFENFHLFNDPDATVLPDEIKNDEEVKKAQQNLLSMTMLCGSVQSNLFRIVNVLNEGDRKNILGYIKDIHPTDRNNFCFNGYDDNRVRFNELMIKESSLILKILKTKFSLAQYRSLLQDAVDQATQNTNWYRERVARIERGEEVGEVENQVIQLQNNITRLNAERREREGILAELMRRRSELVPRDVEGRELLIETLYWRDEWNDTPGIIRSAAIPLGGLALIASGPLGWFFAPPIAQIAFSPSGGALKFPGVEHLCEYNRHTPFVRYQETLLNETLVKNEETIDREAGIFKRTYCAPKFLELCQGSVEIFVNRNQTPDYLSLIQENTQQIETSTAYILDIGTRITDLEREISGILNPRLETLKDSQRISEKKKEDLEIVLETTKEADQLYERLQEENRIELWYRVSYMLDSESLVVRNFRDFYDNKFKGRNIGQIELPNSLEDVVAAGPLLDAVQTPCGHVFNRLSIETHLERRENCPTCRTPVNKQSLIRVPVVERLFDEFISGARLAAITARDRDNA